jgi:Uncharacterized conserved protein
MPKNIVICFDGTNNKFGSQNTNVVRLVQMLDRNPLTQRLYYDPGVGTLPEPGVWSGIGKRVSEIYGLAFGRGFSWKVQEAYSYLMDFWEPGDQVLVFGIQSRRLRRSRTGGNAARPRTPAARESQPGSVCDESLRRDAR